MCGHREPVRPGHQCWDFYSTVRAEHLMGVSGGPTAQPADKVPGLFLHLQEVTKWSLRWSRRPRLTSGAGGCREGLQGRALGFPGSLVGAWGMDGELGARTTAHPPQPHRAGGGSSPSARIDPVCLRNKGPVLFWGAYQDIRLNKPLVSLRFFPNSLFYILNTYFSVFPIACRVLHT